MFQNTGAVAVLVLSIFIIIPAIGYFRLVAEGAIPTNSVLTLLVLRLLSHLDIIAPLSVYVSMPQFLVGLIALYLLRRRAQNRSVFADNHGTSG